MFLDVRAATVRREPDEAWEETQRQSGPIWDARVAAGHVILISKNEYDDLRRAGYSAAEIQRTFTLRR